jgi:hypothetical protein
VRRRALLLVASLLATSGACNLLPHSGPADQIDAALRDLAKAGFEFEVDVHFQRDRYQVCHDLACAHLRIVNQRRTILIAPEAFESPSQLRAALLEIWERYREPRATSVRDLARGALRVAQDGERVGVEDVYTRRRAHHSYRQLYGQLAPAERADLPNPDDLVFP